MRANPRLAKRTPYPTDLTDAQWGLIADLIPEPIHHPNLQEPVHSRREIVNAILYCMRVGCQWRNLPHDFPPWETVFYYFNKWKKTGHVEQLRDRLQIQARLALGRRAEPTLGIIDSQSTKTTEVAAEDQRGFDAGKKVKGRKRHILVDVCGIILAIVVTVASVQDRDGAVPLIHTAQRMYPTIVKILVDGAYVGDAITRAEAQTGIADEVTKRNEEVRGLAPVRLRWGS